MSGLNVPALARQLRALTIRPGDTVLVHSSMKALAVTIPPEMFLKMFMDYLGPEGTLLFPALTFLNVPRHHPYFHAVQSEPCIGLLPRVFHRMDGVVRSIHPTHSVCAYGRLARTLTEGHAEDETPVGPNSPFRKLIQHEGKLLFIGPVTGSNTFMHGVEEMARAPYALRSELTRYHIDNGACLVYEKEYFTHNFDGWHQMYEKVCAHMPKEHIARGALGGADCVLMDARAVMETALDKMNHDPYFFVVKEEDAPA
jgi:aminoglycoside 3-N-acetyltransferase